MSFQNATFPLATVLLGCSILACATREAAATDGFFDPSWAGGGRIAFSGDPTVIADSGANQIIVESNGDLLLGGNVSDTLDSKSYWWFGQLSASGVPTPTFGQSNGSGIVTSCYLSANLCNPFGPAFAQMALQADGRFVVTGVDSIARVTAQGHTLDTASVAGNTGYANLLNVQINDVKGTLDEAHGIVRLSSGQWLAFGTGRYSQVNSGNRFVVIRLNSDFSLDTTFNNVTDSNNVTFAGGQVVAFNAGGFDTADGQKVLVQDDQKILLIGNSQQKASGNAYTPSIARLAASGSIDATYAGSGKVTLSWAPGDLYYLGTPGSAKLDRSGRLLLVGQGILTGEIHTGTAVVRLLSDGTPDDSFDDHGVSFHNPAFCTKGSQAYALAFDSAGRILVAGSCSTDSSTVFLVERLFGDDGSLDTSFGASGFSFGAFLASSTFSLASDIVIDSSGLPVLVGSTSTGQHAEAGAARLTYDLVFTSNFEIAPPGRLAGQ